MKFNPFSSFFNANLSLVMGRLHFPVNRIGEKIKQEDGEEFTIFRQMIKDPGPDDLGQPGAVFKVRFRVADMSLRMNKVFSLFTIPFFAGLPGFRSKLWLLNEKTGFFMGIYEWATVEHARNYSRSFAMNFMTSRSESESVSFEIIPTKSPDK
jgi:hypothetical protein